MNFVCDAADFKYGFSIASRACPSRSAVMALQYIKIEAHEHSDSDTDSENKESVITFVGFDGSLSIRSSFPAKVSEAGTVLLDAKMLNSVLTQMTNTEEIQLISKETESAENTTVQFRCGALRYSFAGLDAGSFPEIPTVDVNNVIAISPENLKSAIDGTIFATSDNDARPITKGILFEVDGLSLTTVASDGYRLALKKSKLSAGPVDGEKHSFVVPQKISKEVSKALSMSNSEEPVLISVDDRSVTFVVGEEETTLSMPLLNGTFFNYRSALPKSSKTRVICKTRDAINCANSVAAILQSSRQTPIKCSFKNDSLEISATIPTGQATNAISASIEGEPLEIGFNVRYFLEALKAVKDDCVEEIEIGLSGPLAGATITANDTSKEFLYLVLPVRMRNE